jgi:hypothetical protein
VVVGQVICGRAGPSGAARAVGARGACGRVSEPVPIACSRRRCSACAQPIDHIVAAPRLGAPIRHSPSRVPCPPRARAHPPRRPCGLETRADHRPCVAPGRDSGRVPTHFGPAQLLWFRAQGTVHKSFVHSPPATPRPQPSTSCRERIESVHASPPLSPPSPNTRLGQSGGIAAASRGQGRARPAGAPTMKRARDEQGPSGMAKRPRCGPAQNGPPGRGQPARNPRPPARVPAADLPPPAAAGRPGRAPRPWATS